MALNFRIFHHRNNERLHLRLVGDFDGSSALELVNTLREHHGKVKQIVVHTDRLTSVHPFGLSVFQKKIKPDKLIHMLTFTGKYSRRMAWEGKGDRYEGFSNHKKNQV